jgi:cation:H+ antiporter
MGLAIAAALLGFVVLIVSAERFVLGASALARNLGVSPLVVGLLIVGFGTSAPEMLVSGLAAWQGNAGLSVGNAVGSNITNIALILGVGAVVRPLEVHSSLLRRELPVLLAAMLIALVLLADGELGRADGLLLVCGFATTVYATLALALGDPRRGEDAMAREFSAEMPPPMTNARALTYVVVGLLLLLASSRLLVWAAVDLAQSLGVSDLVIGLTVVAVGTSLPELAATIAAALKNEHDIAIGNVVGSNTFNILAVLGLPGLIAPGQFMPELLMRDFPTMIALTLALFAMAYGFRGAGRINRLEGALLLMAFVAYQTVLFAQVAAG